MDLITLYIHWDPDPIIFDLFGRGIRWYGLLFASGLLGAFFIAVYLFKLDNLDDSYVNKLLLYVTIGALVGSRLGHVFFYQWDYYSQHLAEIPLLWQGGLASHGAVIGIAIMIYIYSRRVVKKPFFWVGDHSVAAIAFSAAFIRFGNFVNSEIIGKATTVPWAIVFDQEDQLPRHPSQLYEGFTYIVLSIILFIIYKKTRGKVSTGFVSGLFFVGMFSARFFLEFFKENQVDSDAVNLLNIGQQLSLPFIALGLVLIYFSGKSKWIERF